MDKSFFSEQINVLKQSPIFAMSLGSKELFHSNFWKYLLDTKECSALIKLFFEDIDLSKGYEIEREKQHMDLVIITNGQKYVVENKIKSYPSEKQLIDYTENDICCGVITGIKKPPFIPPKPWHFVSYSEIANTLRAITFSDQFLNEVVKEYCKVLDAINYLMDESLKESNNVLSFWSETTDLLYDINLMDVYRKLKGDDFVHFFNNKYQIDLETKAKELSIGWRYATDRSFNNAKATLSFKFIKRDELDDYISEIGIQIEGEQFRLFFGAEGDNKENLFKKGLSVKWFCNDYDKKTKNIIEGKESSMRKEYCSYGKQWIYQYFNLSAKDKDYNLLSKMIFDELNRACLIIKSKEIELLKK